MKLLSKVFVFFLICSLLGCSWWKKDDDNLSQFKDKTAGQLFSEAKEQIKKEQYSAAILRLEALETLYPFSDYTEQAELDLIFAYYKKEDYASAAASAERFIHAYPSSPRVDYAYYMKGMANFQQLRGPMALIVPMDESWRDPGTAKQAYVDFSLLIEKFPQSKYRANALQRMIYLRNLFAARELNAAQDYYGRGRLVAALERAKYVVKNYPQAACAEEALALEIQLNQKLGLHQSAAEGYKVYEATYHHKPANIKPEDQDGEIP